MTSFSSYISKEIHKHGLTTVSLAHDVKLNVGELRQDKINN